MPTRPKDLPEDSTRSTRRTARVLPNVGGANQDDAASADIHKIVGQYQRTGTLPIVHRSRPLYGDFTLDEDIHAVRERHEIAHERFMELPSSVRAAANNDWVEFLEMFGTPEGLEILQDAGLVLAPEPPAPAPASGSGAVPPEPPPTPPSTAEGDPPAS